MASTRVLSRPAKYFDLFHWIAFKISTLNDASSYYRPWVLDLDSGKKGHMTFDRIQGSLPMLCTLMENGRMTFIASTQLRNHGEYGDQVFCCPNQSGM
jgi:hypothetical protein